MKNIYSAILFLVTSVAYGSDTLTFRQVYNFNVGDTFDYSYSIDDPTINDYNISYYRKVVLQKTLSANGDTIYYSFGPPGGPANQQLTVTNLDSFAINSYEYDSSFQLTYYFDTTSYPGYLSNTVGFKDSAIRYTEGLGVTEQGWGYFDDDINEVIQYVGNLVYYSNGTTTIGTPYYILNGSTMIKFIPLPEQCTTWTRTVYGPPQAGDPYWGHTEIIEQVSTGQIITNNGINYVELIYSGIDYDQNNFVKDSILGYFYNDSVNQVAWIVNDPNSFPPVVLCDFSQLNGQQCSTYGQIIIDTVLIGSSCRTEWRCSSYAPGDPNNTIVAGIGNLSGLVRVRHYYIGPYEADGDLTCFNVCGDILYTMDSVTNCDFVLSIKDVTNEGTRILLYPTITSEEITITKTDSKACLYGIYDVNGRLIIQGALNEDKTLLNVGKLSDGMYLMKVLDSGNVVKRFIVQH